MFILFFTFFCSIYFQNDGGHLIIVTKKNGNSQTDPVSLFFAKPEISQMSGDMTTKGGQTLQVTGSFFGPILSNIMVTLGGLPCTNVIWKSDSLLQLVTPPMTGAGDSKNMVVVVTAGNQSNKVSFAFNYTAPTITSMDLLAQTVTSGADGVRMIIYGTGFPDVTPIADRIVIRGIQDEAKVPCRNVERVSYKELRCDYPQDGRGATGFHMQVEAAGQTSNGVPLVYCDDVRIDSKLQGVVSSAKVLERGQDVSFTAQLSTPLAVISGAVRVRVAIVSGGEQHCTLMAPLGDVQRSHSNYDTPFFVNIMTLESEKRLTERCVIKLTLESEDPCYNESAKTFKHALEITVTPKICS